ncbi:hypothetical protein ML056_003470 [Klebsiella variicola]|uniref:HP1 family phage holin n=1 Tax=Klebsiella TaxID=570 RepID=UPI001C22C679|nr:MULTISPECIES: HP1 family phage holin [Klebsiella]EIY5055158.1 hypothetical protein [Klebsiella variicola]MCD9775854.1 phage holin family protein [Klebsiella variicola subsp. variicola]QXA73937.1 phage holin family protein [Klebsiella aerogenes]HCI6019554.1 hypothetical protein [Klebsiella quasipneumoniae subsp. quasipneumoniae]
MNEKITNAPYWFSGISLWLSALGDKLHGVTLYEWLTISGLIIGPCTFALNWYFQWRQTRAIERAARAGLAVTKSGIFKK